MFRFIKIILLIILGAAIELSLTIVRTDLGFSFSALIGFTILFFITYVSVQLIRQLNPFFIMLSLFTGISAMYLPPRLVDFEGTLISLPDYVVHVLGVVTAWLSSRAGLFTKWIIASCGFAVAAFMFYRGYSMWIHKLNFNTFTGNYVVAFPPLMAKDKTGNMITSDSLKNKLVLLDFWHTRCGACFRKFPLLNEIYLKHQHNSGVQILALNLPLPSDQTTRAFDVINERNYSFPVVVLQNKSIIDSLGISVFPTTVLLNQDSKVIFKGGLENAIARLEKEIKIYAE